MDQVLRAAMETIRTALLGLILIVLAWSACVATSQVRVPLIPAPQPLKIR